MRQRAKRLVCVCVALLLIAGSAWGALEYVLHRHEVEKAGALAFRLLGTPEQPPTQAMYVELGAPRALRTMHEMRLYYLLEAQEYEAELITNANFLLGVYLLGQKDCSTSLHYFQRHLEESGSIRGVREAVETLQSGQCTERRLQRAADVTEAPLLLPPDNWLARASHSSDNEQP